MRIIELTVQNFLGIKAAVIRPDGNVVRLEGKNGAGKSSILNAIWAGLCGSSAMPVNPIHHGETSALIKIDLGEIIVTRKVTEKGMYLDIEDTQGRMFKSPQAALDKLFRVATIDPQAFIDMKPKERRDLLLLMTGQAEALEKIDESRQAVYDERRLVNREIDSMKAKLPQDQQQEPIAEVSVMDLLKEREEEQERLGRLEEIRAALVNIGDEVTEIKGRILQNTGEIAILKERIAQITADNENLDKRKNELFTQQIDIEEVVASYPPSRVDDIRDRIGKAEETNRAAAEQRAVRKLEADIDTKVAESRAMTDKIKSFDDEKAAILNDSKLPIQDLSFNGENLMVGDIPFDDLNESRQITIGLRMGLAMNPDIRVVLIRRGNELDSATMDAVHRFCDENDCQVWVQRVEDEPQGGIWIENGEIAE